MQLKYMWWECCKYLHRFTTPSSDCQSQTLRERTCHMRPLTSLKLFVCTTEDGHRHHRPYVLSQKNQNVN